MLCDCSTQKPALDLRRQRMTAAGRKRPAKLHTSSPHCPAERYVDSLLSLASCQSCLPAAVDRDGGQQTAWAATPPVMYGRVSFLEARTSARQGGILRRSQRVIVFTCLGARAASRLSQAVLAHGQQVDPCRVSTPTRVVALATQVADRRPPVWCCPCQREHRLPRMAGWWQVRRATPAT